MTLPCILSSSCTPVPPTQSSRSTANPPFPSYWMTLCSPESLQGWREPLSSMLSESLPTRSGRRKGRRRVGGKDDAGNLRSWVLAEPLHLLRWSWASFIFCSGKHLPDGNIRFIVRNAIQSPRRAPPPRRGPWAPSSSVCQLSKPQEGTSHADHLITAP